MTALVKQEWNQTLAVAYLRIGRSALIYRMQQFGLEEPGAAQATDSVAVDARVKPRLPGGI